MILICLLFLCHSNKDDISAEVLAGAAVFVLAGPREKFTESELNVMKKYVENGGSLLVLLGEGGEKSFNTNINFLLEEYGVMVNSGKLPCSAKLSKCS